MTIKATINKGYVKKTKAQQKKHVSQMTSEEVNYLQAYTMNGLKRNKRLQVSSHTINKMIDNHTYCDTNEAKRCLHDLRNTIVEYSVKKYANNYRNKRVTVRSKEITLVEMNNETIPCNICYVIDIDKSRIITTFVNKVSDTHESINMTRYNKDLKIISRNRNK